MHNRCWRLYLHVGAPVQFVSLSWTISDHQALLTELWLNVDLVEIRLDVVDTLGNRYDQSLEILVYILVCCGGLRSSTLL